MIGKVKIINNVKTVVPLSNETASDSVASGNMETVTSNAVAQSFGNWALILDLSSDSSHLCQIYGLDLCGHKIVWFHFQNFMTDTSYTQGTIIGTLPQGWRPTLIPDDSSSDYIRTMVHCAYSSERRPFSLEINTEGSIKTFVYGSPMSGTFTINGVWGDAYIFVS